MVERFFSTTARSYPTDHNFGGSDRIELLSGPPSSGKTSLLFQFAFNAAFGSSDEVVFICNRRRLETKPPYLSQGIDPTSDVFQRIQVKYVDDDEGISKYFAAFHLHGKFPVTVIVDDFGDLFDERSCQERYSNPRGRDLAIVRTLALCQNAIMHAKKFYIAVKQGRASFCSLIHTMVTQRGDGVGSFLLKNNIYRRNAGLESEKVRTAKYSIALQYLVLEGISEEVNCCSVVKAH
ncbi:hypothetical protein RJ639_004497 [Escallonia herrerae]|uniref:Uncharacterized protein n=1 Tax=Escallonia herrerae TaxID=1293975 RepID=A0AA88W1Q8_9ASTE|nr:hypothetical protein RJ639_004497 [Escallonia herrerae]